MKRESKVNIKFVIFGLITLIVIGTVFANFKKENHTEEIQKVEKVQTLNDAETEKLFSEYEELYEESINSLENGVSGKKTMLISEKTDGLSEKIKKLDLQEKYKDKQDQYVIVFKYLYEAVAAYNDFMYYQDLNKLQYSRNSLDLYRDYLDKAKAYHGTLSNT